MVKKIIIYRHGERSDMAPEERKIPYSIVYDPPLTTLGHHQAELAANYLLQICSRENSVKLVSSPMLLCVQTIDKLAGKLKLPIFLQDCFGEAFSEDYGDIFERLYARHERNDFPVQSELINEETVLRAKNTEVISESMERISRVKDLYFGEVREECLVVCTHLGVIWGLILALGERYNKRITHYTQILEIEYCDGNFRVMRQGVTEHLQV